MNKPYDHNLTLELLRAIQLATANLDDIDGLVTEKIANGGCGYDQIIRDLGEQVCVIARLIQANLKNY